MHFAYKLSFQRWRPVSAGRLPAESGRGISVFGHAGAILFYAGDLSPSCLYRRAGYYESASVWREIWAKVRRSASKSTVSILALGGDGGL